MAGDEREDYFGLPEILRVIRRRWRWVAGTVIVVTSLILLLSIQQSARYVAEARLLLRTVADTTLLITDPNAQVPFFADRQLQNEIQVIESLDVRREVDAAYEGEGSVGEVTAEQSQLGSDAVTLSVSADDPEAAAELVNLYAEKYIEYSQARQLDELEAANAQIEDRLASIAAQREQVAAPLVALEAQLAVTPNDPNLLAQHQDLELELAPDLRALDEQRELYLQTRESLALTEGLAPRAIAQLIQPGTAPSDPVSPRPVRDGIIGLMLGLGLGFALALAREYLDQSIHTVEDLQRAVQGRYPVLGVIPEFTREQIEVLGRSGPPSPVGEAYRSLRTSVRFSELDRPMHIIEITSPSAGEGKTTTAANLARVFVQAGHRVGVAGCDLRRPAIHTSFDVPMSPGLADVVVGDRPLAEAISHPEDLTYVLPAGTRPPNPSELLGSSRTERAIAALAEPTDYTIIDTAPVLPVTDAIVVSRFADAVVMVVSARKTTRGQLQRALESLELASTPVVGLVLNRVRAGDRGYDYDYDWSSSVDTATATNGKAPVEATSGRRTTTA